MSIANVPWGAIALSIGFPVLFIVSVRYLALRAIGRRRTTTLTPFPQARPAAKLVLSWPAIGTWIMKALMGAGALIILLRFMFGIGTVSHLSDAFPWGIWIGFDVMSGVALAAGAFVIAGMAHIFGVKRLEPLVRPAILTGFLGYVLVILGLFVDLGRPYNVWRPLFSFQHRSVMWEVGICVATYTAVLFIEFLPVILERVNRFQAVARRLPTVPLYHLLRKISIVFVILGVVLSTLHQSSLGSLWVLVPTKLYPLWYSIYLPVFFWLSAVAVGLAMTIVESTLSAKAFHHGLHVDLLADLARWALYVLGIYLIVRVADLVQRDVWQLAFKANVQAMAFWLEMGLGVLVPMIIFAIPSLRRKSRWLFTGAVLIVVFGVVLNRLNVSIVGMWPWSGEVYLPSWMEVVVTAAIISFGISIFALAARHLPVFPAEHESV